MEYRRLGNTGIDVSVICLGTMTWGEQNTGHDAFTQMDYALDHGINFFDTAELYAIPPRAETYGRTEEIIGNWLKKKPASGIKSFSHPRFAVPPAGAHISAKANHDWIRKTLSRPAKARSNGCKRIISTSIRCIGRIEIPISSAS